MKPYIANIEKDTKSNTNFRKIVFTGKHSQLSLMSLKPNQDIGNEVHKVDQFFRVEDGKGKAVIGGKVSKVSDGDAFIVPAGTKHNVFNIGDTLLKLYTIYSPSQHPAGEVVKDKSLSEDANRSNNRNKDDGIPFHMYGAPTGYEGKDRGAFRFLIRERLKKQVAQAKSESKKRVLQGDLDSVDNEIEQLNKAKNRSEGIEMINSDKNLQTILTEGFKETLGNAVTKIAKAIKVPGDAPDGPSIKPIKRNMSLYRSGILADKHKKEQEENKKHTYSPTRGDQRVDRWRREDHREKNRIRAELYGLKKGAKYQPVNDPDFQESLSYQNLESILSEVQNKPSEY